MAAERFEPAALVTGRAAEPQLVERHRGADPQRGAGPALGDRRPGADGGSIPGVRVNVGGVGGSRHHSAAGPGTEHVDPGHAVRPSGLGEQRQGGVEIIRPVGIDGQHRAGDRAQAHPRPEDHPGQSHPADGGLEQRVVGSGPEREHLAVGFQQPQLGHVRAEGPCCAVVLAVDVAGDRPADRDVLSAGQHRNDPAGRNQLAQQPAERHPGLGGHGPALRRRGRTR